VQINYIVYHSKQPTTSNIHRTTNELIVIACLHVWLQLYNVRLQNSVFGVGLGNFRLTISDLGYTMKAPPKFGPDQAKIWEIKWIWKGVYTNRIHGFLEMYQVENQRRQSFAKNKPWVANYLYTQCTEKCEGVQTCIKLLNTRNTSGVGLSNCRLTISDCGALESLTSWITNMVTPAENWLAMHQLPLS